MERVGNMEGSHIPHGGTPLCGGWSIALACPDIVQILDLVQYRGSSTIIFSLVRKGRIEAYCARLESGYTARYRGFESHPFRTVEN